jgi:hypothetical protein
VPHRGVPPEPRLPRSGAHPALSMPHRGSTDGFP